MEISFEQNGEFVGIRTLTPRESCIAKAISKGLANKEIARELGIAVPTVKNHISAIMLKLGVSSRTQVALWFHSHGSGAVYNTRRIDHSSTATP